MAHDGLTACKRAFDYVSITLNKWLIDVMSVVEGGLGWHDGLF